MLSVPKETDMAGRVHRAATAAAALSIALCATSGAAATPGGTAAPVAVAVPPPLSAYGTATIDGAVGPGEWDRAARMDSMVPLPASLGGGDVPAVFLVMNDGQNLYLALQVGRATAFAGLSVEFDADDDGPLMPENGDDGVGANLTPDGIAFYDFSRVLCTPPEHTAPTWCAPDDSATAREYPVAGSVDGRAAGDRPDGTAFIELSHPLDSADDARDLNVRRGDTVGFRSSIQIVEPSRAGTCPDFSRCMTYSSATGRITVASPLPLPLAGPTATATVSPTAAAGGWRTASAIVTITGRPATAKITAWASTPYPQGYGRNLGGRSIDVKVVAGSTAEVPVAAEGKTLVHFFATDADGRSGSWQTVPVSIDETAPVVTPPTLSFVAPATLGARDGTAIVTWAGADALATVGRYAVATPARYLLQEAAGGRAYRAVPSTGTSARRHLAFGSTYRYRVRAIDAAGNASAWVEGPTYRVTAVDSDDQRIQLEGDWREVSTRGAVGGSTISASTIGATATLRFYGTAVAWVASTGPGRGRADVSVDGGPPLRYQTVKPTAASRIVWSTSWGAAGWHTVEIRVTGDPPTRPRVDVDAFLVVTPVESDGPVETVIEAEALPTWVTGTSIVPQTDPDPAQGSAIWSDGRQFLWKAAGPEAWLELGVPIGARGRYRITVYPTKGPEHGQIELFVEGRTVPRRVDLYAPVAAVADPIVIETTDRQWGPPGESLVVVPKGRNPKSTGYWVGIDRIVVAPIP